MIITLDRTFYDSNNVEIKYGDILQADFYPYKHDDSNEYNYYGIVVYCEEDHDVDIRTTVSDNNRVSGISDGNCEYLYRYADKDKHIKDFTIIGNVKNKEDVQKYLRDKSWTYEDCVE